MDPDLRSVKPNQPSDPRERPFHPARHLALRTHVLLVHFSPRRLAARRDQGARPGHRLRDPGQLRHRRRPRRGRRAAQGAAASRAPASRAPHSAATAAAPRRHAGAPRALRHTTPPRPAPPLPPAHGPLGQGRLSGTPRPRCVAVASRQCAGTHTDTRAAWRRGDARDPAAVLRRAPVVAPLVADAVPSLGAVQAERWECTPRPRGRGREAREKATAPRTRRGTSAPERRRAALVGRLFLAKKPAASYSPGPLRAKYHRR
jgi:hypothetical protein